MTEGGLSSGGDGSRTYDAAFDVAALFVERSGVYWDLPGVDPWDEEGGR